MYLIPRIFIPRYLTEVKTYPQKALFMDVDSSFIHNTLNLKLLKPHQWCGFSAIKINKLWINII